MGGEPTYYRDGLGRLFVHGRLARPAEPAASVSATSAPQDDLSSLTRPELQRLARERGVPYPRTATRDDLLALLGGA